MTPALLLAMAASPAPSGIAWLHDDWPTARTRAIEAKKWVAVDVWATWCHSCLSMKNFVLTEPPLTQVKDQHVYLQLDYDLEKNASFFEKFPISVFPTFLVIDPRKETVVARWAGSGSAEQMASFFAHAKLGETPDAVARAQAAILQGNHETGRQILETALADKALRPADRSRLSVAWAELMYDSDKKACAQKAPALLRDLPPDVGAIDTTCLIAYCALGLDKGTADRTHALSEIRGFIEKLLARDLEVEVDDRSSLYGTLVEVLDALGDDQAARKATEARLALLEKAASMAKTPKARATFDYHRLEGYLRLGRHQKALEMLQASERAQPNDFNHPWRIALVHLNAGRPKEGLEAIERALARGYGGRKLRLYSTKIDLLLAAKDHKAARATFREAVAKLAEMPAAQVRPGWRAELLEKEGLLSPPGT